MSKTTRPADFIEWDVRNWSAALDFWSAHTALDISKCSALELGSRNGGLSLWLALQGARVVCSDVVSPAGQAMQQHREHGVSELIRYDSIDAMNITHTNEFDIVIFKSLLGALGRLGGKDAQASAIVQMHRALKKGGELFFAENLAASPLHQSLRRRFVRWGSTWRYISVAEMREFLSCFSSVQFRTLGFAGAFGRGESQRNMLGMLDQGVFNHIVPADWRYIIVGVARK